MSYDISAIGELIEDGILPLATSALYVAAMLITVLCVGAQAKTGKDLLEIFNQAERLRSAKCNVSTGEPIKKPVGYYIYIGVMV